MNLGRCSTPYAIYLTGSQLKKTKRLVHHCYRYGCRSLSSFRTGNVNKYTSLSKIFNKNRNLYNRGQYQSNFTTTCRPTLMAKEIKKGDTVCIIEAMKMMNQVKSEFDGTVVSIDIEDGEPVEFNQTLISIERN